MGLEFTFLSLRERRTRLELDVRTSNRYDVFYRTASYPPGIPPFE